MSSFKAAAASWSLMELLMGMKLAITAVQHVTTAESE
jgi:hypothetical protein